MVVFDPVKPSQMQLTNQTLYLIQLYRYIVCMGLYKRAISIGRLPNNEKSYVKVSRS